VAGGWWLVAGGWDRFTLKSSAGVPEWGRVGPFRLYRSGFNSCLTRDFVPSLIHLIASVATHKIIEEYTGVVCRFIRGRGTSWCRERTTKVLLILLYVFD
jgi:hypothetical protein